MKWLTIPQNHVITLEITSGQVYRGKLIEGTHAPIQTSSPLGSALLKLSEFSKSNTNQVLETSAEDNMNVQLKDITVTARDGRVSHLDQVYIRGSHVRFFIVPDMLR